MAHQHADLTITNWARFDRDQQLLSIGAEMNRARKRILAGDLSGLRLGYERVLTLTELTIDLRAERALRRELLLWRDVIAELYSQPAVELVEHDRAFRTFLQLTPAGYAQLPYLLPARP
jgi:hypothetical protein